MHVFKKIKFLFPFIALTSPLLFSDSATWTGEAGDGSWVNNNNWTAAFPNANTDIATFKTANSLTSIPQSITVNKIQIEDLNFKTLTVSGGSPTQGKLTFSDSANAGIEFASSTSNNTQGMSITFGNGLNTLINSGANAFNILNSGINNSGGSVGAPKVIFRGNLSGNSQAVNIGGAANPVQLQLLQTWRTSAATATMTVENGSTLILSDPTTTGANTNIIGFDVVVDAGATIRGAGVVRNNLTVNGTMTPLGPLPTNQDNAPSINAATNITFGPEAVFNVEVNHISPTEWTANGASALGAMVANGTVHVNPKKGIYVAGVSSSFAGAADENFTGAFTLSEASNADWKITNTTGQGGGASISPRSIIFIPPVPTSQLQDHAKEIATYFQNHLQHVAQTPSLLSKLQKAAVLDSAGYKNALTMMSPITSASTSNARHQTLHHATKAVNKKYYRYRGKYSNYVDDYPTYAIPISGAFIEPIGVFYHQESTGSLPDTGHVGFLSYTYGALGGATKVLGQNLVLEGSFGYTHSNLLWNGNFGNSRTSTLYLAPFLGWFNERAFGNVMVMGTMNFHLDHRRIFFEGVDEVAKSRYKSYDLLLRGNGGFRQPLGAKFWFQPDLTFIYTTFFTNGHKESNAPGLELDIKSNINYTLQPSIRARFIKEFYTAKFCYAPSLYLGALANIPVGQNSIQARFREAPSNTLFNIQGYNKCTYQMIVGSDFYAQRFDKFIISSHFEADLFSHLEVYVVQLKMEWLF